MKKHVLLIAILCLTSIAAPAQALYRSFPSDALGQERNVKILKPRNYAQNPEKSYPLIVVLDGDYLFEPVAGNVDYLSYWDQMPESFVVGLNQSKSRNDDTALDRDTGLPQPQSGDFMNFVMEIITTMQDEYRVAPFTVLVGKAETANLSSFFLMRKKVAIQGFLQIQPEYSSVIASNLVRKISELPDHHFFYVGNEDGNKELNEMMGMNADSLLSTNKKVHLKYDAIENVNKYTVTNQAIPRGLQYIFNDYQLVDADVFLKETLADASTTSDSKKVTDATEKLLDKYEYIKDVYGVDMNIRLVDIVSIAEYLIKNKDWDQLEELAQLAHKEYPDILYGRFIEGMSYEGLGRPSRAIKSYNAAYTLSPAVAISKDMVLDRIEMLQTEK